MSGWVADFALALGVLLALLLGACGSLCHRHRRAGLLYFADGLMGFRALGLVTWGSVNSFTLTAIPLFILMADILLQSGSAIASISG